MTGDDTDSDRDETGERDGNAPTDVGSGDAPSGAPSEDVPSEDAPTGMSGDWTDRIVGERMQVDKEFSEKVAASHFSRGQWGLIMTAVEFDIENPTDPERARLVADTSKLPSIAPELERMESRGAGGMGGMADAATLDDGPESSGGFLDGVKDALGIGGGDDEREQLAAAEEMAQMYADDLQAKLEERGKWETVRADARE